MKMTLSRKMAWPSYSSGSSRRFCSPDSSGSGWVRSRLTATAHSTSPPSPWLAGSTWLGNGARRIPLARQRGRPPASKEATSQGRHDPKDSPRSSFGRRR